MEAAALHAFAENAFAATELLARAELLWLPDPRVYGAKTHRTPRNLYNQWANLGNTEQRFATLLNFLTELRNSARYGHSKFALSPGKATECMETIWDMRRHVEEVRPKRSLSAGLTRSFTVVAKRNLLGGQIVDTDDASPFK